MRSRLTALAASLALLAVGGAADAAEADQAGALPRPAVEYQAELRIESGGLVLSGPVHYTPDKERRTLSLVGSKFPGQPIILRRDKALVWVLDPERNSYRQSPWSSDDAAAAGRGGVPQRLVEKTEVGGETVDGTEATRYRVRFSEVDGTTLVGEIWISPDNIVLRIEGALVERANNRSQPFRMALTNLERAPQAPELFELPRDFTPAK